VRKMGRKENFIKRVYEIVQELKIPLIDERVYSQFSLAENKYPSVVRFTFEEDESVIRGFLGLGEYFHMVIIKIRDTFNIPYGGNLFKLDCR
jgi:hypothetical protein